MNGLGFVWSNITDDYWLSQFSKLKLYRIANPTSWPSQLIEFSEEKSLSCWCTSQRRHFKKGTLEDWKINNLNGIQFSWDPSTEKYNTIWDAQFNNLIEFRKVYKNRWPKNDENFPPDTNLAHWCITQRAKYKKGILENWKIEKLNHIGFNWEMHKSAWDRQFNNLKEFKIQNPNIWLTNNEEFPLGNRLGAWCGKQRQKKDKLSEDKKLKLDEIGFPWIVKNLKTTEAI